MNTTIKLDITNIEITLTSGYKAAKIVNIINNKANIPTITILLFLIKVSLSVLGVALLNNIIVIPKNTVINPALPDSILPLKMADLISTVPVALILL